MKNSSEHKPGIAETQIGRPDRIDASTPYDFRGQNLTPYGGLLPVITMLEKTGFRQLVEELVTVKRVPRCMSVFQFVLAEVLAVYVGFPRLHHLRFVARDPMLTGAVAVERLPVQSTFWRFMASLQLHMARQLVKLQSRMRERVWAAGNVRLRQVTLDTDTTVHTLYGEQMGGRKEYNPKKKGKKSYQPMLTFLAETREYVAGGVRNGHHPNGKEIAHHLELVFAALPACVERKRARADSGFYCWEAIQAYEKHGCEFVVSARKTARLIEAMEQADWKPSRATDADEECEFWYQPEAWGRGYRFLALRYRKQPQKQEPGQAVQYQLFDTPQYRYRAFITNRRGAVSRLVQFYDQRAAAENLIKEANNDAGLTMHPYHRFDMNRSHFQLVMLAYNLNCWLMLFHREEGVSPQQLQHITLATARLRFLFIAAKIWKHGRRVGISYSDHYQEKGLFERLMQRLRRITPSQQSCTPVLQTVWI